MLQAEIIAFPASARRGLIRSVASGISAARIKNDPTRYNAALAFAAQEANALATLGIDSKPWLATILCAAHNLAIPAPIPRQK